MQLQADLQAKADGIEEMRSLRHATERAERAERAVAELQQHLAATGHHQPGRFQLKPAHLQQLHMSEGRHFPSSSTAQSTRHRWDSKDPWTTQLLSTGVPPLAIVADLWWQSDTIVGRACTLSQHVPCGETLADGDAAFTDLQHAASLGTPWAQFFFAL